MSEHIRQWRTGRSVGRTIYAVTPDGDKLIGLMDTQMLANEAVQAHNERLARILATKDE
jgi:hypothetical protein